VCESHVGREKINGNKTGKETCTGLQTVGVAVGQSYNHD